MVRRIALDVIVVFVSLALAEVLLRAIGFQPWSYDRQGDAPIIHEPDPVLGWQNKRGQHLFPPNDSSGQPVRMTFLENGRRRTGVNRVGNVSGELVLVGCSFTQGLAINDDETYAWKIQEQFPSFRVLNYGTGGYGSYQSLLILERELPSLSRPKFVLYGFIAHHEVRNAAPASWLRMLTKYARAHVDVAFATFDEKKGLVRHPPEGYLSLPFRESSAIVALLEEVYMEFKTRRRTSERRLSTEQIILQMSRVSTEHKATFIVVVLSADEETRDHYIKFLKQSNIRVIDCVYNMTDEMRLPAEGHPNGKLNSLWAKCISNSFNEQFNMTDSAK